ncbi:MAG: aryl-sulfate sulfotransferase [Planctomycetes bacterium]|nr:aryl-sulfate sulfotransferase [Planctomycetota bacterium]
MKTGMSGVLLVLVLGCGGGSGDDTGGDTGSSGGDPRFEVDVYDAAKAYNGTTFFSLKYDSVPRVVQVDMSGNVVWEYEIPSTMSGGSNSTVDAEYLADTNTVLILVGQAGIFEVDYATESVVWSHLDAEVSHDADRVLVDVGGVPTECILYVWGMGDQLDDAQVKMVRKDTKELVWSWKAVDHFGEPYLSMGLGGDGSWTHANAVSLLPSGDKVMISLRDFQMTVVVDYATGNILNQYDWAAAYAPGGDVDPHEPEWISGTPNHVLVCLQNDAAYQAVEIEWPAGVEVWTYAYPNDQLRTARDADRLPNGNTLIQGVLNQGGTQDSVIFEVTPSGEIVWQMRLVGYEEALTPGFIYKAQRVGS